MKKTHEQFVEELYRINKNIEVIGAYVSARKHVLVKCKIDGNEWESTPDNLLHGKGCKLCATRTVSNSKRKSFAEVQKAFENRGLELLTTENEIGLLSNDHLRYVCPIHGEQNILWGNFIKGAGCRKCADQDNSLRIKKETWGRIQDAFLHSEYKLVSAFDEYTGAKDSCLRCVCQKHGEFYISWNNFNYGEGCPACNSSIGEKRVLRYLIENNIRYERQKKFDDLIGSGGKKLSYDFFIPEFNLLIEYQGQQHESPICFGNMSYEEAKRNFKKQQEHDVKKRDYASNNMYNLFEIWYYDFNNINDILDKILTT